MQQQSAKPLQSGRLEASIVFSDGRFKPPADQFEALRDGARSIQKFIESGGHFDLQRDSSGASVSAAVTAMADNAGFVAAYIQAGGKLTTQWNPDGKPPVPGVTGYGAPEASTLVAARWVYEAAVKTQGGLITPLPSNQFDAALDGPEGIALFVKQGGKFTTQPNRDPATLRMMETVGRNSYVRPRNPGWPGITHVSDTEGRPAQHMAAALGAEIITAYAKAGGVFTDDLDSEDLTAGMLVLSRGSAAIAAFCNAGGRFTDKQNSRGVTAGMVAVMAGPDAINDYAKCGGLFTEQEDERGMTAALLAVTRLDEMTQDRHQMTIELRFPANRQSGTVGLQMNPDDRAVESFAAAGGHFSDHRNRTGESAGMLALMNGPATVRAWYKAGGRFTSADQEPFMSAERAATRTSDLVRAYCDAGGTFPNLEHKATGTPSPVLDGSANGYHLAVPIPHVWGDSSSAELDVVKRSDPAVITAYSECGGLFTDRDYGAGWTSERIASHLEDYEMSVIASHSTGAFRDPDSPATQEWLAEWRKQHPTRDEEGAKVYASAIARQGGVRHVNSATK